MPNRLGAGRRARELVDPTIGAGSDAICGPPLFLIPRAENSPARSMRLIVKNNKFARAEISRAKTTMRAGNDRKMTMNINADDKRRPYGTQRTITNAPEASSKGPARFPARARSAQFMSFNFPDNLIWPIESTRQMGAAVQFSARDACDAALPRAEADGVS